MLQDFDAQPYGLEKYLPNVERYVRGGGGLVMVGGQNSFVAGGYAGTPLARVLPVELDGTVPGRAQTPRRSCRSGRPKAVPPRSLLRYETC